MKVLVCGGRNYKDAFAVAQLLLALHQRTPFTKVIHGDARGADRLAGTWAQSIGIPVVAYPARWDLEGRAAGPRRNQRMLDQEHPDLCVAFPGGRGTADMTTRAHAAGLPIVALEPRVLDGWQRGVPETLR